MRKNSGNKLFLNNFREIQALFALCGFLFKYTYAVLCYDILDMPSISYIQTHTKTKNKIKYCLHDAFHFKVLICVQNAAKNPIVHLANCWTIQLLLHKFLAHCSLFDWTGAIEVYNVAKSVLVLSVKSRHTKTNSTPDHFNRHFTYVWTMYIRSYCSFLCVCVCVCECEYVCSPKNYMCLYVAFSFCTSQC